MQTSTQSVWIFRLAAFATCLAFVVIILGAYTRLTDAGLGCPDWPGCYGQLTVPKTDKQLSQAAQLYPEQRVESAKAWAEMIHRYVAGTLGLLILALSTLVWRARQQFNISRIFPVALVGLLFFQAALGMWTVTLKLYPLVVMGHLLGGMTLFTLLAWLTLRVSGWQIGPYESLKGYRTWATIAFMLLACQIALGGWTSSNYAALACPDFPFCQGQWIPSLDFETAFKVLQPIGPNYEGGLLNSTARITINTMHRFGAIVVLCVLGGLGVALIHRIKRGAIHHIAAIMTGVLGIQMVLGVLNITQNLPLGVAVTHNAVAVVLLFWVLVLNIALRQPIRPLPDTHAHD